MPGTTTASTSWCSPTFKIDGETMPAMMKADRNGFFFVANRETRQGRLGREVRAHDLGAEMATSRHFEPSRTQTSALALGVRPRASART